MITEGPIIKPNSTYSGPTHCCYIRIVVVYAAKFVPLGYGIKKLQIMLTIVDDLVFLDTLIEECLTVEPIDEYVQSCNIVAFNKI
ncbi:hypothetical protein MLD38_024141 [Melastoma candidum]|uniref:Uncharacterized protein n=1 Tax=Melastoma candidum TaxID=119954 RepID=A0ACB9NUS9_9MYRT|nr:hypothetical protein MLD38_024141 [Melastoma candidum]